MMMRGLATMALAGVLTCAVGSAVFAAGTTVVSPRPLRMSAGLLGHTQPLFAPVKVADGRPPAERRIDPESGEADVALAAPAKRQSTRPRVDCAKVACVALTFDDGPGPHTARALDLLRGASAPATFFVVGNNVATPAYAKVMRRMIAEGHEVGNHTWNHPDMLTLGAAAHRAELTSTSKSISGFTGRPVTLYRPPYGNHAPSIQTAGMAVVMWSVDTLDWRFRDRAVVAKAVRQQTKPGDIILMHDIHAETVESLPSILKHLRVSGFTPVTVSELLTSVKPGQIYHQR